MIHPGDGMSPYGNSGPMFPQRWHDNMLADVPALGPLGPSLPPYAVPPMPQHRMLHDERFLEPHRYQQLNKDMMFSLDPMGHQQQQQHQQNQACGQLDAPRYTKWRERRDVITNLDRQTAQSSSRTDSLKSSLQQQIDHKTKRQQQKHQSGSSLVAQVKQSDKETRIDSSNGAKKAKRSEKITDPQEISDGEIIDDESSDDEDMTPKSSVARDDSSTRLEPTKGSLGSRAPHEAALQGPGGMKRRREAEMDYETISDEELDDFMSERKEDGKSGSMAKSSSEMELLNALGLDWANLVEMSKQSKKEANTSGSALRRFSLANYLPTLAITKELAGPEIFELVTKICH